MIKKRLFATCLLVIPVLSISGVHKCNIEGKIVYQQSACPKEKQSLKIKNVNPEKEIDPQSLSAEEYNKVMLRYAGTYIPSSDPYIELKRMQTVSLKAANKANACKKEISNIGTYGKKCLDFFAYSNGKPKNTPANGMALFLRMTRQNSAFKKKNKAQIDKILDRFVIVVNMKKFAWNAAKIGALLEDNN